MQIAKVNAGNTVEIGVTEKTNFRIEADGKMFRLLSDTLYQNKIGSMVREVSCNALDAHIAAGTPDVPFVIHAPCQLEPWFSVIDTGVGLSHDEVTQIFTCFGKSTKSNSNTMVGAFGFGSKTPFAYTNAFTVISIKDGIRNSYAAVIGDDNLPTMNLLDTQKTDAHDGVEITVSVDSSDFCEFYHEISQQLRFFKVKPIIKGSSSVIFDDPLATAVETINGNTVFRKSGSVEAVQGGVAYPIYLEQLKKGLEKRPNASLLSEFIDNVVYDYHPVMFFDIGQIAVTPSRESISYDLPTVTNILNRLDEARAALTTKIEAEIDALPTLWEKTVALRENRTFYSRLFKLSNNKWGIPANGINGDLYIALPPEMEDSIDCGDKRVRHMITVFFRNKTANNFRMSSEYHRDDKLYPTEKSVIVLDDGAGAANSRIRRFLEENDREMRVYFFNATEAEITSRFLKDDGQGNKEEHCTYGHYVQGAFDPVVAAKVLDAVEGAKVILLSDLPKMERVRIVKMDDGTEVVKERAKYTLAKAYKFTGDSWTEFNQFKCYEKIFVAPKKMTEPAAYVKVDGRTVTLPEGMTMTGNDLEFLICAMYSGDFTMPVYALRDKDIEKIKDNPLWKSLNVVAAELRPVLLDKYKSTFVRFAMRFSGSSYGNIINNNVTNHLKVNVERLHDPLLRGMLARMKRYDKRRREQKELTSICRNLFGEQVNAIIARLDNKDMKRQKVLCERYPAFQFSGYGWSPEMLEDFIDLLNIRYQKTPCK